MDKDGCVNGYVDEGWMGGQVGVWMGGWAGRCVDGWVGGWIDKWVGGVHNLDYGSLLVEPQVSAP